ncbi:MAG: flagellar assembly peptidoglycan hydrolase FlgJ [Pseudomonadota bacterium]
MLPASTTANVYTDLRGLEDLKRQARNHSPQALLKVAQQFESLFTQMMLKSMRDAGISDGLLQNDKTRFFQDMHDKQLSLHLSEKTALGLAKLIVDQLGGKEQSAQSENVTTLETYRNNPVFSTNAASERGEADAAVFDEKALPQALQRSQKSTGLKNSTDRPITKPREFVERMLPYAKEAAKELGVAPGVLIAQAALETGWGHSVIKQANGGNSHNLFNIKADSIWKGDRVTVGTVEFENGVAVKRRASFRAYADFGESFRDYVRLVKNSPRYENALRNAGNPHSYIDALQEAGYATDPQYAAKVKRIFAQVDIAAVYEGVGNDGNGAGHVI